MLSRLFLRVLVLCHRRFRTRSHWCIGNRILGPDGSWCVMSDHEYHVVNDFLEFVFVNSNSRQAREAFHESMEAWRREKEKAIAEGETP